MQVEYLEIVTTDVDKACAVFAATHGVQFGESDASLGGARTAEFNNGGKIGVRAPMHKDEQPETRSYLLVKDVESAIQAALSAGAVMAHPPLDLPGHGKFAIYVLDGMHHGLWQR